MLFRDFLLALPGLISPISSPSRANDSELASLLSAPVTAAKPSLMPEFQTGASVMPLLLTTTASGSVRSGSSVSDHAAIAAESDPRPLVLEKQASLSGSSAVAAPLSGTAQGLPSAGGPAAQQNMTAQPDQLMTFLNLWADRAGNTGSGSPSTPFPGTIIGGVQVPGATIQKFVETIQDALKELPAHFTQPPGTTPEPAPVVTPPTLPAGEELPLRL